MNGSLPKKPQYRKADLSDVVFICSLLKEFYQRQGGIYGISFDYPSAIAWIQSVVLQGIAILGPTSCAGAIFVPFPFNRKAVLARVEFWYFRKPREIGILDELTRQCRWLGATHIGAASHYPDNRAGRLYARFGMVAAESYHIGPIEKTVATMVESGKRRL